MASAKLKKQAITLEYPWFSAYKHRFHPTFDSLYDDDNKKLGPDYTQIDDYQCRRYRRGGFCEICAEMFDKVAGGELILQPPPPKVPKVKRV